MASHPGVVSPAAWGLGRGVLVRSVIRIVLTIGVLLLVYALLPVTTEDLGVLAVVLPVIGVVAFGYVFQRSIRRVSTADYPGVRGMEALALVATFFVVGFAYYYMLLSTTSPESFNEPLSKVSSFYFTVTVLTTTGFGDISAATDPTRIAVTVQMVLSVLFVGVAVRLLVRVAQTAHRSRFADGPVPTDSAGTTASSPAD